jgi:hypothetical protein
MYGLHYRKTHKVTIQKYRLKHKGEYYKLHKKEHQLWAKAYYKSRSDYFKRLQSKYQKTHKVQYNKYRRERRIDDINFKLRYYLSNRIRGCLKLKYKFTHFNNLLGCSVEQLKQHLEQQFKPGMSWENYGYYGWHIDHIRPCASFDLSKPDKQKQCFHYTNLQPLWAKDNMSKGSR